jgi:hypothetical protein
MSIVLFNHRELPWEPAIRRKSKPGQRSQRFLNTPGTGVPPLNIDRALRRDIAGAGRGTGASGE